jgi:hypothetical protein
MKVERTDKEIIIRIPNSVEFERAQQIIDYIRYLESTSSSKATQEDVDNLANDINREWWDNNKDKFLE